MGVPAASGYPQYSGSLISPMFSLELLERFYTSTIYSDISTTEYTGELEKGGDQITFWREPEVIVRDAHKNKKIEHDTINAEPVTMVIDRAKEFSIKVSQIDEKQIQQWPKWKESFLRNAGYQLAQAIDPDLLDEMYTSAAAANQGATAGAQSASINLGTAGAPIVLTSSNIIEVFSQVHQVLDEAKAPREGRFITLPPAGITALRNSDLQAAYMTGLSWSPLTNGKIPDEVMGFTIMQSLNIPSEIDATVTKLSYDLVAGVKMATAFAAQLEKTRVIEDKDDWATYYQGLTVYGFKVLYPEALVHIYATFDATP
jgi:hypothetical protein